MNIKLGQLRRWTNGAFKDGLFLIMSKGPYAYLIEEYGVTRHVSYSSIMSSELVSDTGS
jgi:hypothetical protein